MRFRNAFLLLLENFKNVYKILLYKLIVALVCTAIYCALILPELNVIFTSAEWLALKEDGLALLATFMPTATQSQFTEVRNRLAETTLPAFAQMVLGQTAGIVVRAVCCVLVYLLQRFVDTVCYFTVGSVLNDRMATYGDTPFFKAYLLNLSKSAKYSLVYVPIVFLFDLASIVVCIAVFELVNLFYAPFLCVSAIALCQTLKLTFTSHWMPRMVTDDCTLRGAMRGYEKTEKKHLSKVFSTNLSAVFCIIALNVLALLFTAGSALLLTVPASYLFLLCLQFVNYYTVKGKKYFITYDNISTHSSFGDTAEFFKAVEEEERSE